MKKSFRYKMDQLRIYCHQQYGNGMKIKDIAARVGKGESDVYLYISKCRIFLKTEQHFREKYAEFNINKYEKEHGI